MPETPKDYINITKNEKGEPVQLNLNRKNMENNWESEAITSIASKLEELNLVLENKTREAKNLILPGYDKNKLNNITTITKDFEKKLEQAIEKAKNDTDVTNIINSMISGLEGEPKNGVKAIASQKRKFNETLKNLDL